MAERRVLLIVGGGIAAYKALELVRQFKAAGVGVRAVLTKAATEFVTPMSFAALTTEPVHQDLFSLTDEAEMGHIVLSRSADLIVVAPATADLMAKAANGLANDLASTLLLATDTKVLMAPAMNVRMWEHPATVRNRAQLEKDGVAFVGPDEGEMACGEYGPGRMAEPPAILEAALEHLRTGTALLGRKVLVTAGPTRETIDPVRFLSNRSSGRQGYAVASALAALGAEVTLVSGPTGLPAPAGVRRVDVETADEMLAACLEAGPLDAAVMVAAVADWKLASPSAVKLKKGQGTPELALVPTPDILKTLSAPGPKRPRLVVGFAAETNDLEAFARAKLDAKGCDLVIGNDVTEDGVMGGGENRVVLVSKDGSEAWPRTSKAEVARKLADRIAELLH